MKETKRTEKGQLSFAETITMLVRTFSFLGKEKRRYLTGWLLSCGEIGISLLMPFLYKLLVESFTNQAQGMSSSMIVIFGFLCLLIPVVACGMYLKATASAKGTANMRKKVFAHIQKLPVSAALERRTGDYITRLTSDVDRASMVFQSYSITMLTKFIVVTGYSVIVLFYTEWRLAVFGIAIGLLIFYLSVVLNPKVRSLEIEARTAVASSASYFYEALQSIPVIRVFLLQKVLGAKFEKECDKIYQKRLQYRTMSGRVYGIIDWFCFSAQPLAFLLALLLAMESGLSMANAVFLAGVIGMMADSMLNLSGFIRQIQPALVSAGRVFELLGEPEEEERENRRNPDLSAGSVLSMKDVCFSYDKDVPVLENFDLEVKNGEKLAVVGGSGGGKSTLYKLIQALYQADSGSIEYFGIPSEQLSIPAIRGLFSYVPQDCILFEGTVAENIALFSDRYKREDIIRAALQASLHDFILTLENGYETVLGENGLQLSGGQKQRIVIARAILKNAPIILMDEPTSALDGETELAIGDNLDNLMRGKTVITIAHRLSTIRGYDRIIVLEHGKLAEQGNHTELIKKNGRYAQLCRKAGE